MKRECRLQSVPGPYIEEDQQVGVVCGIVKTFLNAKT